MNNTKRLIALSLVLCLSLFAFAACKGDEELDLGSSQAESEHKAELFDGLPDKKYGGSVVFLVPGDFFQLYGSNEIIAQESSPNCSTTRSTSATRWSKTASA